MSVKIRLTKTGKRNQIQYRIVVQDTRAKRDGKFLEILGNFNPFAQTQKLTLAKKEYEDWLKKGAKPTPSLAYLIENGKLPKKAKKVKVEKAASPKPAETKTETPTAEPNQTQQDQPEANTQSTEEPAAQTTPTEEPSVKPEEAQAEVPATEKPVTDDKPEEENIQEKPEPEPKPEPKPAN